MINISVVICTYNRANSLADTLLFLTKQTYAYEKWELIVVDNNSNDNTKEIVSEFTKIIPNLFYKFEPKQGLSYARNLGISSARGELIAFTDDDVLPENDWLLKIYDNIKEFNCDACGGYISPQWETPPPHWLTEIFYGFLAIKTDASGPRQLTINDELPFGANMAFQKSLFTEYGLFDTNKGRKGNVLAGGEDIEMFERIISNNRLVYYFPSIKVAHKVESFRLKKSYFRRWRFQCSENMAISTTFESSRQIFGIPFYLINQTIQNIIKSIYYLTKKPEDIAFRQEMIVWHFLGLISGIIKSNRSS
ncbi:MAG: glycosyltransferase [Methylomicrobium sp.]|nr:glycosyltransferase [Methylomicrobium sp.]